MVAVHMMCAKFGVIGTVVGSSGEGLVSEV
jgi:hypothetical protein